MRIALAAALLALAVVQSAAVAAPAAATDRAAFDAAIARLRGGATDVDLYALRMQSAALPGFTGGGWAESRAAFEALKAQRFDQALKLAEARLAGAYLDIRAHIAADAALKGLGRPGEAAAHERLVRGLLDSIVTHGDGKSAATAWTAIEIPEEYDALGYMGLTSTMQSLRNVDGRNYDVMTVTDASGRQTEVWFGIDLFFGKEFGGLLSK